MHEDEYELEDNRHGTFAIKKWWMLALGVPTHLATGFAIFSFMSASSTMAGKGPSRGSRVELTVAAKVNTAMGPSTILTGAAHVVVLGAGVLHWRHHLAKIRLPPRERKSMLKNDSGDQAASVGAPPSYHSTGRPPTYEGPPSFGMPPPPFGPPGMPPPWARGPQLMPPPPGAFGPGPPMFPPPGWPPR